MTTASEARGYVNVKQAMEIAGVSRRTIYNWMEQGKLRTVRTPSGRPRIDPASLFVATPDGALSAGTVVHVEGLPVRLKADVPVERWSEQHSGARLEAVLTE